MQLTNHDAHIGKETLCVYLAPDGNNDEALESLIKKASTWSDNIRVGHLSPTLAWHAANTIILKSLEYPLPALTLTFAQCKRVMSIIKKGLLNSSRICTSIPNCVLQGPVADGGLKLNHLYLTQGLLHLMKRTQFL